MDESLKKLRELEDESLIECIDQDRQLVFSILYDRYEKRIFYKALSMLKNRTEAADLAHDIFIKIFTSLEKFEGRSKFSLWVHSISFNTCVKYLSQKKKLSIFDIEDQVEEVVDNAREDLYEKELLELNLDFLEECIGRLKEEERMLVMMKYMDGLTIKEIAEITNMKESKIKMNLMRTREKILGMYQSISV